MARSDSEGSLYEPEHGVPLNAAAPRAAPPASAAIPPPRDSFSSDPSASFPTSAVPTGMNTSAVGTPMGSEGQDDGDDSGAQNTTAEATPDPQPQPEKKKSRALNFLKKKGPQTSITIKGVTYQIRDDEIVLPDDPRGEAKIDSFGNLLGGRAWKVHTFTSPLRPNVNKVYILSIDAARAAGFRDSLYFFRRNPQIHKLTCNQEEKDRLIELGRLSGNLKSRAVTMVSARNVFKVMGATFVADGKYVFDDYYEDKAIAAGHKPGEPAFIEAYDPDKDTGTLATSKGNAPPGATSLGLNHLIGHPGKPKVPGAELMVGTSSSGAHATFGGTGLQPFGRAWDPLAKKAKPAAHLTWQNWMLEYALNVREENAKLVGVRQHNIGQVQVGLDVEEREEDCWEWIEEEYSDDEREVKPDAAAAAMQLDSQPPSASTTPAPAAYAASPAPAQGTPAPPFPSLPSLPSVSTPQLHDASLPPFPSVLPGGASLPASRTGTPGPAPAPVPAPPPPRPKKRRMVRVYNPIRGVYDPETNVPHVYRATQPRAVVEYVQVDKRPRLSGDGEVGGGDELRDAAKKAGIASVEVRADERAWALENGGKTVLDAIESRRGREDLVPGCWDFLEIARQEGVVP
ncbi:chromatin structure-remodeling complex subunit RSC7 [Rhodotorula paludigena]|uniref:chromatin structure-remodeling complex subunit RSC7 n=1 Tax=Rhodotorula paludigena TaxID=86838 RepID=UPI0031829DA3